MAIGPGFNGFPIPPAPAGPDYNVRTPWVRPVDWLNLPELLSTDQKMVGLFAVWPGTGNVVAMTCRGAYTVDWGDGTTENVADNTLVNHTYDYADADLAGTECTRGYKQAIITVTAQGGSNLTSIVLDVLPTVPVGVVSGTATGWLDITVSSSNLATLTINPTQNVKHTSLEQFTIINHSLTSMNAMFRYCYALQSVPLFNTAGIADFTFMFDNCNSLSTIPPLNTSSVTNMTQMVSSCWSMQTVPLLDTANVTSMTSMFKSCSSLRVVPLFDTRKVTDMSYMFQLCACLTTVPCFNTAAVTTMASMFASCSALQSVPLFNTSAVITTGFTTMFSACVALQTVPLFDTSNATSFATMFAGCKSLQTVPLFNTSKVTSFVSTFTGCLNLQTVPLFDTTKVTTFSGAFGTDSCLQTIPAFNTAAVTTMATAFGGAGLMYLPTLTASAFTAAINLDACPSLSSMVLSGDRYTISIANCRFATPEIEALMDGLGKGVSSPTLTISGNIGAPAEVSKASSGTTSGSTTVTLADTSTLAVGMEVRGTGISDAVAVTMQDAGDTVTRAAHGIADGTRISFATIVTTTGIVVNTPYYVVGGAADTFQVSDTLGGSAKALTTDGSGTVVYGTTISAIDPNVSFTLSIPASATASVTTYSAVLKRSKARLHGFTVTG